MLLTVEKGIRGGIWQFIAIHPYGKANNKYMEHYDKNKESSYLKYWDVKSLYGWAMSQNISVNKFKWIEDTTHFNKDFINNYNEEIDGGYFIEVDVQYPQKLHGLHKYLPFLPGRIKIEKLKSLFLIYIIKLSISFI